MSTYIWRFLLSIICFSFVYTSQALAQQGQIKTLTPQKFQKQLNNSVDAQLIDVRTEEEYKAGHLSHSINYNVMDSTLQNHIASLDKDKSVFVYCRTGVRSLKAAEVLSKKGFNVFNLKGGITLWGKRKFPIEE